MITKNTVSVVKLAAGQNHSAKTYEPLVFRDRYFGQRPSSLMA